MANPFSLMVGDSFDEALVKGHDSQLSHSSSSSEKDLPLKFQLRTLSAREHESPPPQQDDTEDVVDLA